ncbi:MAG: tRNA 2-thiouridine(34) synthase MnmA, partial [FCB group bacterium]|nr:tRNA 2-thiouridine(34) synthase MnmA [FCB group bacterium]
ALYSQDLTADEVHWIGHQPPEPGLRISAKIRYRQPDQPCRITEITDNRLKVSFEQPQFAVAPGQSVVFYYREECLGGAIIERAIITESVKV